MASDLATLLSGFPVLGPVSAGFPGVQDPTQLFGQITGQNLGLDPLSAQILPQLQGAQSWLGNQLSPILNYPMNMLGKVIPNFGLAQQGVNPPQSAQLNPMMPLTAFTPGTGGGV